MLIRRLTIHNFRGIRHASIHFTGHTLLLGPNNVGKSTVLEALDLLLGPERLSRGGAIEEHDFFNGIYRNDNGTLIELRLEAVLTDLGPDACRAFRPHLEWWDRSSSELAHSASRLNDDQCEPALRVGFKAIYDPDEDEFRCSSFFCHPPTSEDEEPPPFTKTDKRLCGFLYLRGLRTGNRALSLEKGTLLDIVLQLEEVQAAGMWEDILTKLRSAGQAVNDHAHLSNILSQIENRVHQYIPLTSGPRATSFHITNLTRNELRRVVSLFLACQPSEAAVPFQQSGSGTLNVLVLAMLSFIADLKQKFIFAMEEPETALPPYTQRRIVDRLRAAAQQCFVTSHSPYIAERFLPDELCVLRRDKTQKLTSTTVTLGESIKQKMFRRDFRTRFAEGMLSQAVLLVEGVTEREAIPVASERLSQNDQRYSALDVCGVTVIDAGGEGSVESLGSFYRSLGLRTYAFIDRQSSNDTLCKITAACDYVYEHSYSGFESLLTNTLPTTLLCQFLQHVRSWSTFPSIGPIPTENADANIIRKYVFRVLTSRKGDGYAAELVSMCPAAALPTELTSFLRKIADDLQPTGVTTGSLS